MGETGGVSGIVGQSSDSATGRSQLSVLLIEDNPHHAELVTRCLEELGIHKISKLANGAEALDYFFSDALSQGLAWEQTAAAFPNLVLLDLRLPKVDGLHVLTRIRGDSRLRELPVVVLSSSAAPKDVEASKKLCVDAYLVKPLALEDFETLMNRREQDWLKWRPHSRA